MSDQSLNVIFHDGSQSFGSPITIRNPVRKLADPDEVVAANTLSLPFGDVEDNVASREVENILLRFGEHKLIAVISSWKLLLNMRVTFI
jgi:hypothetical protein